MDSYQSYWNGGDYGDNYSQRQSYYDYPYYYDYNTQNYSTKETASSKYTSRANNNYSKNYSNYYNDNQKSNSNYYYNTNKDYSYEQYNPVVNQLNSNSSQYYSQKNKYLITFHSQPRKNIYDTSSDGRLQGYSNNYNNNCTFYVSGSSDLKSLLNNMNTKTNNRNKNTNTANYNNYVSDKKTHEKNFNSSHNILNDNKYNNNYNRYINNTKYDSKNKENNNRTTRVYTSSTEKVFEKKRNQIPISLKKNDNKININIGTKFTNNTKKNYLETEPNNKVKAYSQKTAFTPSIKQPLISTRYTPNSNKEEEKPKYNNNFSYTSNNNTKNITNYNNTNKNSNKEYKTSTNTNFTENTRTNYFKKVEEKPNYTRRRNNTPNLSRLHKYKESNNIGYYNNVENKTLNQDKKIKNITSEIPHNFNRQQYQYKINTDTINNLNKNPQPKRTLNKVNSNSNLNASKNRYNNFEIKPRTREYATKTQVYSYNNGNYSSSLLNKTEKEINPITVNNIRKKSPKKYETNLTNLSKPKNNRRNFSVQTEKIPRNRTNNYLKDSEYEITDINEYRRKNNINNKNTISNDRSSYERGAINIRDNKKEIEKDENKRLKSRESNHHKVYISSNLSNNNNKRENTQPKSKYRFDNN